MKHRKGHGRLDLYSVREKGFERRTAHCCVGHEHGNKSLAQGRKEREGKALTGGTSGQRKKRKEKGKGGLRLGLARAEKERGRMGRAEAKRKRNRAERKRKRPRKKV